MTIKQKANEGISSFQDSFQIEFNLFPRADQKIAVIVFMEGLRMSKFKESVMKKMPLSLEEKKMPLSLEEVNELAYIYIRIVEVEKRDEKRRGKLPMEETRLWSPERKGEVVWTGSGGRIWDIPEKISLGILTKEDQSPWTVLLTLLGQTSSHGDGVEEEIQGAVEGRMRKAISTPQWKKQAMSSWIYRSLGRLQGNRVPLPAGRNMDICVDDMLIKRKEAGDHEVNVMESFENLRKYDLRLNLDKCIFDCVWKGNLDNMAAGRHEDAPPNVREPINISPISGRTPPEHLGPVPTKEIVTSLQKKIDALTKRVVGQTRWGINTELAGLAPFTPQIRSATMPVGMKLPSHARFTRELLIPVLQDPH
ncbi:hypothetical protein LIER_15815 [Lithospermum erythrorhizon]|uniref:Uncharacterized protein n=1 Tax=Lithospermum erythrorhizon TaxID=34254 RepID=A0AAV3Q9K1_LITER